VSYVKVTSQKRFLRALVDQALAFQGKSVLFGFEALTALRDIEHSLAPRKPKPLRTERLKEKRAKKASKREETSAIYREVEKRAGGSCEACGVSFNPTDPPELDHALGRGKKRQSVRNCWLIHRGCHRSRHAGKPSREWWLERWSDHCAKHGFLPESLDALAEIHSEKLVRAAAALVGVGR
jgi:hypothetical protein